MAGILDLAMGIVVKQNRDQQYSASNKTNDAGPVPTPQKQMLPRDLLVHARQLEKEEINKAIVNAVKSNKIYTTPPVNAGMVYTTMGYTTEPWPQVIIGGTSTPQWGMTAL